MFPKIKDLEFHQAKFFWKYPKYLTKQLNNRSVSELEDMMENAGSQKKDCKNKLIILFWLYI